MGNPFWLTNARWGRLTPFVSKPHGKPRVDDRLSYSPSPEQDLA